MRLNVKKIFGYAMACLLSASVGFFSAQYLSVKHVQQDIPADSSAYVQPETSTFEQFRKERQQLRSMQKAQLNEIIFSADSDSETVRLAQRQLLDLLSREEKENTLEGLLEIRGFEEAVASIHGDSASILISAEVITQQQSGMILDLVCRETGFLSGNIKIIPIK